MLRSKKMETIHFSNHSKSPETVIVSKKMYKHVISIITKGISAKLH